MRLETIPKRYEYLKFFLQLSTNASSFQLQKDLNHRDILIWENEIIDGKEETVLDRKRYENCEVLYHYGLGLGTIYHKAKDFLEIHSQKDLVIIEDDLGSFPYFLEMPWAEEMMRHPQIHLKFVLHTPLEEFVRALAKEFPAKKIACVALKSYQKKKQEIWEQIQEKLYQFTTIENALWNEDLYYPRLFSNLAQNFLRIPDSSFGNLWEGSFSSVPAIICGAGPSLQDLHTYGEALKSHALILAGGSGITAMIKMGITPHMGMAIDPNENELHLLQGIQKTEMPLIYGMRVYPGIFPLFQGSHIYLHTQTGGFAEYWMEQELGLKCSPFEGMGEDALSVTTSLLVFANLLGCNPIILAGVDLGYTNDQFYTEGVAIDRKFNPLEILQDDRIGEKAKMRTSITGKSLYTNVKWEMEQQAIGQYLHQRPHLSAYNLSQGLPIEHVPAISIEKLGSLLQKPQEDVTSKIQKLHAQYHIASFSKKDPYDSLKELDQSLTRCSKLLKEVTSHPFTHHLVFELQLTEEIAYQTLLVPLLSRLKHLGERKYRTQEVSKEEIFRYIWQKLEEVIPLYQQVLTQILVK